MYNMTNITNADNLLGMFVGINQLEPIFGIFLLGAIFLIIFAVSKRSEEDTKAVLLLDCTITSVLGILLWTIGIITWMVVIIPIVGTFASLIIFKFTD